MEIPQKATAETKKEKPLSRFNQITQEKKELERSTNALKIKDEEIKKIREELNMKINSSIKKITLSMDKEVSKKDFPALEGGISSKPLLNHAKMHQDENVQRNLQSIQYNEAYIKKLDEIGISVNIAIARSEFIVDKIDTDLKVASVIGKDIIDKMSDEISNGIKENIPLSTNLDLNNQNIEPTTTLLDIWNRIYKQWTDNRNKVQTATETLDQFKKSITTLGEKDIELSKLLKMANEKADLARNKIKNLKQRGRITREIDSFGIAQYVNYTCASFEEIKWDKSTIEELLIIQHNETHSSILSEIDKKFDKAIKNSISISQRINIDIDSDNAPTLIAKNESEEIINEIKKLLQDNLFLINNLNINKLDAVSSITIKEIWERSYAELKSGCQKDQVIDSKKIIHNHGNGEDFHEHNIGTFYPEHCTRYSDGTEACGL